MKLAFDAIMWAGARGDEREAVHERLSATNDRGSIFVRCSIDKSVFRSSARGGVRAARVVRPGPATI